MPGGQCHAGQFVWRPAGSRHEAWAGAEGGVFLAMFQIPNKFFRADGRETDFRRQRLGEELESRARQVSENCAV